MTGTRVAEQQAVSRDGLQSRVNGDVPKLRSLPHRPHESRFADTRWNSPPR